MGAIVLNTLTGAVSEYDNFEFDSITPTHAGGATGLYTLGGDLDDAAPIVAEVVTGKTLWGNAAKKRLEMVYFSIDGSGDSELTVFGKTDAYTYSFPVRDTGESRCPPGKGIRENYLAFGFRNADGADFTLDRIEVLDTPSKNRRV